MGCQQTKTADRYSSRTPSTRTPSKITNTACSSLLGDQQHQQRLLDFYTVGQQLGQGAFGVVYACKPHGEESKDRAVKMVDKAEIPEWKIAEEASFLQQMDHPNVIKFFDVLYESCFVCIVMERLMGGDLISGMQRHRKAKGDIPFAAIVRIISQMAHSICYLHRQDLVHRDVQGHNYLCDRSEVDDPGIRVVLADFGTVAECTPETRLTDSCGTKVYWSPEFFSRNYSQKVDIWAMGVVCYGLMNGRFPFRDEQEVRNKVIELPEIASQTTKDFLNGLLCKKEEHRLSAEQVANHLWMQSEAREEAATVVTVRVTQGPDGTMASFTTMGGEEVRFALQESFTVFQLRAKAAEWLGLAPGGVKLITFSGALLADDVETSDAMALCQGRHINNTAFFV